MRLNAASFSATIACAIGLAACSPADLPAGPDPVTPQPSSGWLTLQLTTPRTDDGAVQFHVTGPALDSIEVQGFDGFGTVTAGVADLIVTGMITTGTVARVHVSDAARVADYRATVVAAAARGTYLTGDVTTYRASLVR